MEPVYKHFRSRLITDTPATFMVTIPAIGPAWMKCRIWLATGRGPIIPRCASDLREVLATDSIRG